MTDLPTPLTDALYPDARPGAYDRMFDHARSLERRMSEARKLLAEARDILPMDMRVYSRLQEAINHLTP